MDFIEGNQGDLLFQESKNSIEQNHRLPSRTAQNLQIRFLTRHEIIELICMCCENGYAKALRDLLSLTKGRVFIRPNNPLSETEKNKSFLHLAVKKGHLHVARELLEHKANPNSELENGTTPLSIAAKKGNNEMISLLLEYGANVTLKHTSKVLIDCIFSGKLSDEISTKLYKHGLDPNRKSPSGKSPLDLALENSNKQQVRTLILHGATPKLHLSGTENTFSSSKQEAIYEYVRNESFKISILRLSLRMCRLFGKTKEEDKEKFELTKIMVWELMSNIANPVEIDLFFEKAIDRKSMQMKHSIPKIVLPFIRHDQLKTKEKKL